MRWMAGLVALPGCVVVVHDEPDVEEVRDTGPFDRVANEGRIDIEVVAGQVTEVVVRCRADKIDQVETEVVDGELQIHVWSDSVWETWGDCRATVTSPRITELSVSGSGDLYAAGPLPDLAAAWVVGSGDLWVEDLGAQQVDLGNSGSGDLIATGVVGFAALTVTGSGDLDAAALEAVDAAIESGGSGDLAAHVSGSATVDLYGSGDVLLSGEPQVDVDDTGSGDLILL